MNPYFIRKAAEKESLFFRRAARPGMVLYTLKQAQENVIEKITERYVFIRSVKRNTVHRIPRSILRRALTLFYYRRVVTLKQLIKIHSYSSALAALIKAVMRDICKIVITKAGAVRMTLRGIRYYYSGLSRAKDDVRIVKENGGRFILLNYASIKEDKSERWKINLRELGYDYRCVLLDPGEKTLYDAIHKGKKVTPIDLAEYASFVIKHSDIIYQYLTLDKIGDSVITMENTKYLELAVGRRPIPIYHIQSPIQALQELVEEEYDVIAIGGSALRSVSRKQRMVAFDQIFERYGQTVNFHALGLGAMDLLLQYPWASSDSSSWLCGRMYRKLMSLLGLINVPEWMSSKEAMAFNVRLLSTLEERYGMMQTSYDMYFPI